VKIKSDFITNSSSSSFIAWGVSLDKIVLSDEMKLKIFDVALKDAQDGVNRNIGKSDPYYANTVKEMLALQTDDERIEYVEEMDFEEKMQFLFPAEERVPFSWETSEYCEGFGIAPSDMIKSYPEVTFGETKNFVAAKINDTFGTRLKESDITFFEESWYNG
jgi:hypothetical protein